MAIFRVMFKQSTHFLFSYILLLVMCMTWNEEENRTFLQIATLHNSLMESHLFGNLRKWKAGR